MPHGTLNVTSDGLVVPIMVGVTGQQTAQLLAAGQPVPAPVLMRGIIDTGSDVTAIAAHVLSRFNLPIAASHSTQTVAGAHRVDLFDVSLSIPRIATLTAPGRPAPAVHAVRLTRPNDDRAKGHRGPHGRHLLAGRQSGIHPLAIASRAG